MPSLPKRVPHHKPIQPWLKRPHRQHWVNAVLATVVQLAQPVTPVAMVAMVSTACPASLVIAVHQLHQPQNWCPKSQINAHAKLHPETLVLQDPKDPMDHPAMLEHPAPTENQAIKDPVAHPAHQVHPDHQETKAQPATLVALLARSPVQLVHPAPLANLALQVHQVAREMPEKMVAPVVPDPRVMLALQAVPAKLAALVVPEIPAELAHPAAANTAHQHVWLLVIKHPWSVWLVDIFHQRIRDSVYSIPHHNQLGVTSQLHAIHVFKTFHVKMPFLG
jgi:hypothetical protein